jgi:hypothetical protein
LTPRAALCYALSSAVIARRRSMATHFACHFLFFRPTPESYVVPYIFFANIATFPRYVEMFVTFATFALCYVYEFTVFAL